MKKFSLCLAGLALAGLAPAAWAADASVSPGPLDSDRLEAASVFMFDGFFATASVYGLKDQSGDAMAIANLLGPHLFANGGAVPFFSSTKKAVRAKSVKCSAISDSFARKDCATDLFKDFNLYAKQAARAKFVRVSVRSVLAWDEKSHALDSRNTYFWRYAASESCLANAVCASVGVHSELAGHNYMLCLRLPANYSPHVQTGDVSEVQARDLSARHGALNATRNSMVFEITKPVALLATPTQCPESGSGKNKLMAVGDMAPRAMLLGDPLQATVVSKTLKFLP